MKKIFKLTVCMMTFCMLFACGKKEQASAPEQEIKYAKTEVSVFKDPELSAWGTNLSKTEAVTVLERSSVKIKNTDTAVAKVKLSDETVFYVRDSNLAGDPVVFTAETKCYARNNEASKVYCSIPAGTIAFVNVVLSEWTQIYAGQIGQKWVTQQWVKEGFSSDPELIARAKKIQEAAAVLGNEKSSEDQKKTAAENLEECRKAPDGFLKNEAEKILKSAGFEPAEEEINEPVSDEPESQESEN